MQPRGHHFHFPGRDFGIGLLAADHLAFDGHHKFRAQLFRFFVRFGMHLVVEHDLRQTRAVAQVNEDQLAQIAAAMDPAHQDHLFFSVRRAQVAAVVGAFQIAESIEQDWVPFRWRGLRI